jgi:hypothetical protein
MHIEVAIDMTVTTGERSSNHYRGVAFRLAERPSAAHPCIYYRGGSSNHYRGVACRLAEMTKCNSTPASTTGESSLNTGVAAPTIAIQMTFTTGERTSNHYRGAIQQPLQGSG